ncbi:MAG TPA: hypothetical protein VGJ78_16315 [Vicinamibacterales bacterium]
MKPSAAAWSIAALFAIAVSASVFRIPIQVSDSAGILEAVDAAPSVTGAFTQGLRASRTMLRPMRQTTTKLLLELAHAIGDRYNVVFRGFHAATAALLVVLFAYVARPRDWTGVAALCVAMLVLTGLHTFGGMMREAYPINHFLLVALYCLAAFALAESRGGILADAAACVIFVIASLTLESGLVVFAIAAAAYVAGARGISRNALIAIAVLAAGYVVLRVIGLHMLANTVGERQTGLGTEMLTTSQLRARFGGAPWLLYAYTIVCSLLTVPLSQPIAGQWTAFEPWDPLAPPLFFLNDIGTSLVVTAVIVWYMARRRPPDGRRRWLDPAPMAMLATLAGSAVLSYAYAKSEIMSAAGVFYALVLYLAVRELAEVLMTKTRPSMRPAVLLAVLFVSTAWGWRAMGLQYRLQRGAFDARSEWVLRMPPYGDPPVPASAERLTPQLLEEALHRGRTNPYLLWPPYARLWGEN